MANGEAGIVVIREDALKQADALIGQVSLRIRTDTPAICLDCLNSGLGRACAAGADVRTVRRAWNLESGPKTPLVEICHRFISARNIHRS